MKPFIKGAMFGFFLGIADWFLILVFNILMAATGIESIVEIPLYLLFVIGPVMFILYGMVFNAIFFAGFISYTTTPVFGELGILVALILGIVVSIVILALFFSLLDHFVSKLKSKKKKIILSVFVIAVFVFLNYLPVIVLMKY